MTNLISAITIGVCTGLLITFVSMPVEAPTITHAEEFTPQMVSYVPDVSEEPINEIIAEEKEHWRITPFVEEIKATNAPDPAPSVASSTNFIETAVAHGVPHELAKAMEWAANKYSFEPRYLLAIGLSENATAPDGVGDGGWSFGPFQIYTAVHTSTDLHDSIVDCAKDYYCSSEWTARRMTSYMHNADWIDGLSRHNCPSDCAPQWYRDKIERNGLSVGVS